MLKPLIATAFAAALALGTASTPAAADSRDAARVILGLGALSALGATIAHADHDRPRVVTRYKVLPPRAAWHDHRHGWDRGHHRGWDRGKHRGWDRDHHRGHRHHHRKDDRRRWHR